MELGELIAEIRMDKGLSQRDLGKIVNKSDSAICNYEKGVHTPDLYTMSKIADCFDVSIDYLLQKTDFKYSIKYLKNKLSDDFTIGDLLNTIIQLDTTNKFRLVDYIGMLSRDNSFRKEINKKSSE